MVENINKKAGHEARPGYKTRVITCRRIGGRQRHGQKDRPSF